MWAWQRAGASLGAPKLSPVFQRPLPEAGAVGGGPHSLQPWWPARLPGFACLSAERGARTAPTLSQVSHSPEEAPEDGATCVCLIVGQLGFGGLCVSHCGTVGLRWRGRGWEGVAGPPSSGRTWLQAHGHRRPRPQGQHGLGRWTKLRGARHRLPCWGGAQALAVSTCGDVRVTRGRHPARGSCQSTPASGRRRGAEGPDAPRRACQRRRLQSQHSRSHAGHVGGPPSRGPELP